MSAYLVRLLSHEDFSIQIFISVTPSYPTTHHLTHPPVEVLRADRMQWYGKTLGQAGQIQEGNLTDAALQVLLYPNTAMNV